MNRFYIPSEELEKELIEITGEDFKHLSKVLRLKENDVIELRDGNGRATTGEIKEITSERAFIIPEAISVSEGENKNIKTTLFQAIPKQGKLETIVQKGTELGINTIIPFFSKRSVPKPSKSDSKKVKRLNRIAYEASKQSGRGVIPIVEDYTSFKEVLKLLEDFDLVLFFYENEKTQGLKEVLENAPITRPLNIALIVGPEGGFDPDEVKALDRENIKVVSLGPRILRTETAGISALSQLNYYFE